MNTHHKMLVVTAVALASTMSPALVSVNSVAGAADPPIGDPAHAVFEGHEINLAEGWGEATACVELGTSTQCYRSEAELVRAHPTSTVRGTCSTSVRLYDGTSFNAPVIYLSTTGTPINLSTYGFDNRTSSYKIGACSSTFFDGAGGGGAVYPGNTAAGASYASMLSGWNNRVSSIRIA